MKEDPEQRAILLGEYIAQNGATVRAAASAFGCSKSTVHIEVTIQNSLWSVSSTRNSPRLLPKQKEQYPFMNADRDASETTCING